MRKLRALALLGLSLLGCASPRRTAEVPQHLPPPPPLAAAAPALQLPASIPSSEVVQPQLDPNLASIAALMDEASALFDTGEQLLREGNVAEGRLHLSNALGVLVNSPYPMAQYRHLEVFYLNLVGEVGRMETSLVEDAEPPSADDPEGKGEPDEEASLDPAAVDALQGINLYQIEVDPALVSRVSEDLRSMRFGIPVTLNDRVVRMLDYYQNRLHDVTERGLNESGKYLPMFRMIFDEEGVPQDLVHVAQVESLYKPLAFSRARAKGIWQFTRAAAQDYRLRQTRWVDERSDIEKSTRAAARYLKELYGRFGDWHIALASYNWGPARFERLQARHGNLSYWEMADAGYLPAETANYVPSVLATILIANHPEHYGFSVQYAEPLAYDKVSPPRAVRLADVAIMLDLDVLTLKQLNPELTRMVTPGNDVEYQLKVPAGRGSELAQQLADLAETKGRGQRYRVRSGDTLATVAAKFGTTPERLARTNKLSRKAALRSDSLLSIPDVEAAGATREPASTRYKVRRGDTWSAIARRTGLPIAQLKQKNARAARAGLRAGEFLALGVNAEPPAAPQAAAVHPTPSPAPPSAPNAQKVVHKVKAGETVSSIARKYGTTIRAIRAWNTVASLIRPGQHLTIFIPR